MIRLFFLVFLMIPRFFLMIFRRFSRFFMLVLLMVSASVYAQNTQIKYKLIFERTADQRLRDELSEMPPELMKEQLEQLERPSNEYYVLDIQGGETQLTYEESIDNSQKESHVKYKNFPFGKLAYRKQNEDKNYYQYSIEGENYFTVDSLASEGWVETGKDSVILDYKVKQITLKTPQSEYTAWYTTELPAGLGIHNLSYPKGFVLAGEINTPRPGFEKNVVKIKPYKERKGKAKFTYPTIDKVYTLKEVMKIFRERNELRNKHQQEMQSQGVDTSDK